MYFLASKCDATLNTAQEKEGSSMPAPFPTNFRTEAACASRWTPSRAWRYAVLSVLPLRFATSTPPVQRRSGGKLRATGGTHVFGSLGASAGGSSQGRIAPHGRVYVASPALSWRL